MRTTLNKLSGRWLHCDEGSIAFKIWVTKPEFVQDVPTLSSWLIFRIWTYDWVFNLSTSNIYAKFIKKFYKNYFRFPIVKSGAKILIFHWFQFHKWLIITNAKWDYFLEYVCTYYYHSNWQPPTSALLVVIQKGWQSPDAFYNFKLELADCHCHPLQTTLPS